MKLRRQKSEMKRPGTPLEQKDNPFTVRTRAKVEVGGDPMYVTSISPMHVRPPASGAEKNTRDKSAKLA